MLYGHTVHFIHYKRIIGGYVDRDGKHHMHFYKLNAPNSM